jgi:hypothetical protein
MSERDDIVITAMVEEDSGDQGKPLGNVARQLEVVEVPAILIPRQVSQENRSTDGVPDQDRFSGNARGLRGELLLPGRYVRIGFIGHLREAHVVLRA